MIPLADAALEGIMAHRRIGQEAFRFDQKPSIKRDLTRLLTRPAVAVCA
jgi:hypothetical protein